MTQEINQNLEQKAVWNLEVLFLVVCSSTAVVDTIVRATTLKATVHSTAMVEMKAP